MSASTFDRRQSPRPAPLHLLTLIAALAAIALPPAAHAAGFTQPVVISGNDSAAAPQIAIAPNGRTAAMWVRGIRDSTGVVHNEYRVAIGPDPDHLGPSTAVPSSRNVASATQPDRLFARGDGGFGVCFATIKNKTRVDGCSLASPITGFGPRYVTRLMRGNDSGSAASAVLPDGSLFLLLTRSTISKTGALVRQAVTWRTLGPTGQLSAEHAIDTPAHGFAYGSFTRIGVNDAGDVAIPDSVPVAGSKTATRPAIRIMTAGSGQFAPPIPVSTEAMADENVVMSAGAGFQVQFDVAHGDPSYTTHPYDERFVAVSSAGVVGPALSLPGGATAGTVLPLTGGGLFALTADTATRSSDQDCFNRVFGEVTTGPLAASGQPTTATRLSRKAQIALDPQAAALADGSVVVAWGDAASRGTGARRVEVALRAASAASFTVGQVLPAIDVGARSATGAGSPSLAAGGNKAALLWATAGPHGRTEIVLSTLHAAPPYASLTPPPTHPGEPCSE